MANEWVDLGTGEVVEDSSIIKQANRLRYGAYGVSPFGARWFKMSMVNITRLSNLSLGMVEMRVLFSLFAAIRDGNLVDVNQSGIARELGLHAPNVSTAISRLVEANVLERTDGLSGRFSVYRISPLLAWYGGDNRAHAAAVACAKPLQSPKRKPRRKTSSELATA